MRNAAWILLATCAFAVSSAAQNLLVANQGDRSISVVDAASARQVAVIEETIPGQWGHELAASPDGRTAYLPVYGNSGVGEPGIDGSEMLVIDLATRKVSRTIRLGGGVRPHCIVYEPKRALFYITTELAGTVTVFDPRAGKVVGSIPTGHSQSHMLAVSHDGERGYTSNVKPGSVSVLDLKARKTITVIPISEHAQRISISNDDSMVFTADRTRPRLAVIDTAKEKVSAWIALPAIGYGTAATWDGSSLLVALPSANQVGVVDLKSLKLVRTIAVCRSPQEILTRPSGIAYVSCIDSNQVAVLDVPQGKVRAMIAVGKGADGLAWSGAE